MIEIKMGQTLELDNVLSFRGKLTQSEVEQVGRDMETKISNANAKLIGYPIMATFAADGSKLDMELICLLDKKIDSSGEYVYKEKIKIVSISANKLDNGGCFVLNNIWCISIVSTFQRSDV